MIRIGIPPIYRLWAFRGLNAKLTHWLKVITGQPYRLPTEAEWEITARGIESNLWPWGKQWDADRCNNTEPDDRFGRTTPVGMYPHGASPCSALDMAGNTWEWCLDWFSENEYQSQADAFQPTLDPCGPTNGQARGVRGGSWYDDRNYARCAFRSRFVPDSYGIDCGFRLVLSPRFI